MQDIWYDCKIFEANFITAYKKCKICFYIVIGRQHGLYNIRESKFKVFYSKFKVLVLENWLLPISTSRFYMS